MSIKSRLIRLAVWVGVLGGSGFLAGFIGPMVLTPEANQGPLVGILITGPGGALLGFFLFAVCAALQVSDRTQWRILGAASAILAGVTLFYCLPDPALQGYLIDARVESCGSPAQKVDAAIEYWNKRIADVTWAAPRPNWQADARRRLQMDDSAVVDMIVTRRNRIYVARKPWNRGTLTASAWQSVSERKSYYVPFPGACADYPAGTRAVYFNDYDLSVLNGGPVDWPPTKLPDFLDLQVLRTVPAEYRRFAAP